ncbi:uncharacterized protein G2W53_026849 [Senna tora]|uniref:Uncharacterized protein n=1 Tax=Senna tora TaxID=362788 RepID=A0A834THX8_9FABA|nr:uncharacterized protein G2W53_026849 [Senna tora]
MGLGMTCLTFHAITSPIRALNPLGFQNTTRSDRPELTYLPCDDEPCLSIKSTLIHKYNAKRWQDLTHLPYDHEPHSRITSTRIPIYNAKLSD